MTSLIHYTGDFSNAARVLRNFYQSDADLSSLTNAQGPIKLKDIDAAILKDLHRTSFLSRCYTVGDLKRSWLHERRHRLFDFIQGAMTGRLLTDTPLITYNASLLMQKKITQHEMEQSRKNVEAIFKDSKGHLCGISLSYLASNPTQFILCLINDADLDVRERKVRVLGSETFFRDTEAVDRLSSDKSHTASVSSNGAATALDNLFTQIDDDGVKTAFREFFNISCQQGEEGICVSDARVVAHGLRYYADESLTPVNQNIDRWPQKWCAEQRERLPQEKQRQQADNLYHLLERQLAFLESRDFLETHEKFSVVQNYMTKLVTKITGGSKLNKEEIDFYTDVANELLPVLLINNTLRGKGAKKYSEFLSSVSETFERCVSCDSHEFSSLKKEITELKKDSQKHFKKVKENYLAKHAADKYSKSPAIEIINRADSFSTLIFAEMVVSKLVRYQQWMEGVQPIFKKRFGKVDSILQKLSIERISKLSDESMKNIAELAYHYRDYTQAIAELKKRFSDIPDNSGVLEQELLEAVTSIIEQKPDLKKFERSKQNLKQIKALLVLLPEFDRDSLSQLQPVVYLCLNGRDTHEVAQRFIKLAKFISDFITRKKDVEYLSDEAFPQKYQRRLDSELKRLMQWLLTGAGDDEVEKQCATRLLESIQLIRRIQQLREQYTEQLKLATKYEKSFKEIETKINLFQDSGEEDLTQIEQQIESTEKKLQLTALMHSYYQQLSPSIKGKYADFYKQLVNATYCEESKLTPMSSRARATQSYLCALDEKLSLLRQNFESHSQVISRAQHLYDSLFVFVINGGDSAPLLNAYWQLDEALEVATEMQLLERSLEFLPDYQQRASDYIENIFDAEPPALDAARAFIISVDKVLGTLSALRSKEKAIKRYFDESAEIYIAFQDILNRCYQYIDNGDEALFDSIDTKYQVFKKVLPGLIEIKSGDMKAVMNARIASQLEKQLVASVHQNDMSLASQAADAHKAYQERCELVICAEKFFLDIKLPEIVVIARETAKWQLKKKSHSSRNEWCFNVLRRLQDVAPLLSTLANNNLFLNEYKLAYEIRKQSEELTQLFHQYVEDYSSNVSELKKQYGDLRQKQQLAKDVSQYAESVGLKLTDKKVRSFVNALLAPLEKMTLPLSLSDIETLNCLKGKYSEAMKQFALLYQLEQSLSYRNEREQAEKKALSAILKDKTQVLKEASAESRVLTFFEQGEIDFLVFKKEIEAIEALLSQEENFHDARFFRQSCQEFNSLKISFVRYLIETSESHGKLDLKALSKQKNTLTESVLKAYRKSIKERAGEYSDHLKADIEKFGEYKLNETSEAFIDDLFRLANTNRELLDLSKEKVDLRFDSIVDYDNRVREKFAAITATESVTSFSLNTYYVESINGFITRIELLIPKHQAIDSTLGSQTTPIINRATLELESLKTNPTSFSSIEALERKVKALDRKLARLEHKQKKLTVYASQLGRSFVRRNLGSALVLSLLMVASIVGVCLLASGVFSPVGAVLFGLSAFKLAGAVTGICGGLSLFSGLAFLYKRKKSHESTQAAESLLNEINSGVMPEEAPQEFSSAHIARRLGRAPSVATMETQEEVPQTRTRAHSLPVSVSSSSVFSHASQPGLQTDPSRLDTTTPPVALEI